MYTCCSENKIACPASSVVHLFRRENKPKDSCQPKFGLQDTSIFYIGCFSGVYQRRANELDRLVVDGMPPLKVTDVWLVPGSFKSGFVVNRAWRMGNVTFYEADEKKMPSFSLSLLTEKNANLIKQPGIHVNEKLTRCGDLL